MTGTTAYDSFDKLITSEQNLEISQNIVKSKVAGEQQFCINHYIVSNLSTRRYVVKATTCANKMKNKFSSFYFNVSSNFKW